MRFEKWQGLGNDFIVLYDLATPLDDATVGRLCDRRFGIGADGVLLVETAGARAARMVVRNADGSRPEMCGNGLRCVASSLAGELGPREILVRTDAGDKACRIESKDHGGFEVEVDMGVARRGADLEAILDGRKVTFLTVDMGNPHAVSFDVFGTAPLERVTPLVAAQVPGGTNVELCEVRPEEVGVVVWERGVGPTLACGTGACAVAVAACGTGRARHGVAQRIRLPGGVLDITVSTGLAVRMRGPAQRVFAGEVSLP